MAVLDVSRVALVGFSNSSNGPCLECFSRASGCFMVVFSGFGVA